LRTRLRAGAKLGGQNTSRLPVSPAPGPKPASGRFAATVPPHPNGSISRLAIIRAIPAGSRRARSQRAYVRAVLADPVIAALRADAQRAVLELARILARHANWPTMTSWRPRARACAEIGSSRDPSRPLSISAYKRARQVLEDRGFLGLVAQGWTSALRAGPLDDREATSAVFVLTIPLPRRDLSPGINGPLTGSRSDQEGPHARETTASATRETVAASRRSSRFPMPAAAWSSVKAPKNRGEEERAADVLRDRCPPLRRISARYVRHLVRDWFAAGWTPADLAFAVEHSPGGRHHGYTTEVEHVPGWLRSRLASWRDRDGRPVVSPGQRREADRARVRAEQRSRLAERRAAAERAAQVDVAARVAGLREIVTAARWRQAAVAAPGRGGRPGPRPSR
jgi:hypothetical protein